MCDFKSPHRQPQIAPYRAPRGWVSPNHPDSRPKAPLCIPSGNGCVGPPLSLPFSDSSCSQGTEEMGRPQITPIGVPPQPLYVSPIGSIHPDAVGGHRGGPRAGDAQAGAAHRCQVPALHPEGLEQEGQVVRPRPLRPRPRPLSIRPRPHPVLNTQLLAPLLRGAGGACAGSAHEGAGLVRAPPPHRHSQGPVRGSMERNKGGEWGWDSQVWG